MHRKVQSGWYSGGLDPIIRNVPGYSDGRLPLNRPRISLRSMRATKLKKSYARASNRTYLDRTLLAEGRHSRGVLMAEQAGGGTGEQVLNPAAGARQFRPRAGAAPAG